MRSYYASSFAGFLSQDSGAILAELVLAAGPGTTLEQKDAWDKEIAVLKKDLYGMGDGHVFLEFEIPRMGKRADAILLFSGVIFVVEFKVGSKEYTRADIDQCVDYALDLKDFHEGSHKARLAPVLVATQAPEAYEMPRMCPDGVLDPARSNGTDLKDAMRSIAQKHGLERIDHEAWVGSRYRPSPTIIEAATALYSDHRVEAISGNEAGHENLGRTTDTIERIIEDSKRLGRKSICFVTGVPGAGKTLVGLNLSSKRQNLAGCENAVFLSGNGPLVAVLREALAMDSYGRAVKNGKSPTKGDERRKIRTLIQGLPEFFSDTMANSETAHEKIVIVDEAQRAWDSSETDRFLKKKRLPVCHKSQAELLIGVMDRHPDWAVIVCLVGGGQEINHNEAGLPEWFEAVHRSHPGWDVYVSDRINDKEHLYGRRIEGMLGGAPRRYCPELHLAVNLRARSEVSEFVRSLLDIRTEEAADILRKLDGENYPIVMTRNFDCAKRWLRRMARGNQRFGIVAAAKSYRLKPYGIYVELAVNAIHWFLKPRDDPRSSYSLEYAATEFKVQGLELDWTCVAWDGDLMHTGTGWNHREFSGDMWKTLRKPHKRRYLENAYRVLLTRARKGMVIFIPEGDEDDRTRRGDYYDRTYEYLRDVGIRTLKP